MRSITKRPTRGSLLLLTGLIAGLAGGLTPPARAEDEADFEKMLADKSPALVTVKFVLKTKSAFGENETEREVTGVMIEPDGLVLCANSSLSSAAQRLRR